MRLDRFITLSVVRPLRSTLARSSASPQGAELGREVLPVLMYHSISDREETHLSDYYKVCTAPAQFRLHMQTLKEHGYLGVDLATGLDWLNAPPSPPSPPWGEGRGEVPDSASRRDGESKLTSPPSPPWGEGRGEVSDSASCRDGEPKLTSPPSPLWGEGRGEVSDSTSRLQPVAITFDDGFRDFYTEALPVLVGHGFAATMYLPTAFIGETRRTFSPRLSSRAFPSSSGLECMTWSEVLESQSQGIRFESHTVSHPRLYELQWRDIESELRDSRAELEQRLGRPIVNFAYPYAFPEADRAFCERLRETLIGCGYRSCVTTVARRVQKADDAYTLRRLPMNGADDASLLLAKLTGAYDWMEPAQRSIKRLKHLVPHRTGKRPVPTPCEDRNP